MGPVWAVARHHWASLRLSMPSLLARERHASVTQNHFQNEVEGTPAARIWPAARESGSVTSLLATSQLYQYRNPRVTTTLP